MLLHNLEALDLAHVPLKGIVLSHAHYDHTGGLVAVVARYPHTPLFAHSDLLAPRYARRGLGCSSVGLPDKAQASIRERLHLSREPLQLAQGMWTTGDISPRPFPEGRSEQHLVRRDGRLVQDDYRDDLALVLQTSHGIVLLCGCCHAGLRNTLGVVRSQHSAPIVAIVGGTHLAQASTAELDAVAVALRELGSPRLYLNHCTGERALTALERAFGDRVSPCPAGTVLDF